jgi:hypothetical protein
MPSVRLPKTHALIEACYTILAEIHPASVRAVCYQLFIQDLIPSMKKTATNRVSHYLTLAREEALIPWAWVVDETRAVERVSTWDRPALFVEDALASYRRNWWNAQPCRIELWSEKGATRGTLRHLLDSYQVGFNPVHGYNSATNTHDAAEASQETAQPVLVLYVGDFDPSGLHMSEIDLPDRLRRYGGRLMFQRIALTREDVTDGELPSFPASTKRTDTRYRWFVRTYGDTCWELDALSPVVLRARVEAAIRSVLDVPTWERYAAVEAAERTSMASYLTQWSAHVSRQAKK